MFEVLFQNLTLVGAMLGILLGCFFSNTCFGLYYNINTLGQTFQIKRLLSGLLKGLCIIVGLGLLVIALTFAPTIVDKVGLTDYVQAVEGLSIIGIGAIIIAGAYSYGKKALAKFKAIVNGEVLPEDNDTTGNIEEE